MEKTLQIIPPLVYYLTLERHETETRKLHPVL